MSDNPFTPDSAKSENSFGFKLFTFDSKPKDSFSGFAPSKVAERTYERQLRSVAGEIEKLCKSGSDLQSIEAKLNKYAEAISPWAETTATNLVKNVNRKNAQAWQRAANRMGIDMRKTIYGSEVGYAVQGRIKENVKLIKSLALGAADQVGKLSQEALISGTRAEDIALKIAKIGEVSLSRARTIARTEVSKASTALTMARADSVGSSGYIWRTARDGDTRSSHRAMEGVFVRWDSPPTIDGMTGHAGEFPNCRCYPEPVIPQEDDKGVYKPALPTRAQEINKGEKELFSQWEKTETSQVIPHAPDTPLFNVDKAKFEPKKLTHYAMDLKAKKLDGRDKAKAYKKYLGLGKEHADLVENQIMSFLPHAKAFPDKSDHHGVRFYAYVPVTGINGKTIDVKAAWIYDRFNAGENISTVPRLTTCFIDDDAIKKFNEMYRK